MRAARTTRWSVAFVLASMGVFGCKARAPTPVGGAIVFQISARHASATDSAGGLMVTDTTLVRGRDTLFLHAARIVLAELAIAPSVSNECEEEEGEKNPPCVVFDEKPVLVDLPLGAPPGAGAVRRSVQPAPATDYNLFEAAIHRPDSVAIEDVELLFHHPELWGSSIRVEGTISRGGRRRAFTFNSGFNEEEEISLEPAVTVAPRDTLRLTLRVDVASWFRSADGRFFVDPATAGLAGRNEALVRDNIRQSLRVFPDRDADGLEDVPSGRP